MAEPLPSVSCVRDDPVMSVETPVGIALFTPFLLSIAAFRAPPAINSLASGAAGTAVATGSKAWDKGQGWTGPNDEEDDVDEGREPIYVESYQPQERVAVADGGTPRGPGPQPVGALGSGSSSPTAEKIRDFEKRSSQPEGAAAQKTNHYNQNDAIDVPSETVDSGGDGGNGDGGDE